MLRRLPTLLLLLALAVLVSACSNPLGDDGDGKSSKEEQAEKAAQKAAADSEPFLVVNGQHIDADGNASEAPVDPMSARAKPRAADDDEDDEDRPTTLRTTYVAPPLLSDGTIDDGDDPFGDGTMRVHPLPLEDDPEPTRAVDEFARGLRNIVNEDWSTWLQNSMIRERVPGIGSDVMPEIVRVFTMRCGGSKTIASGVVLAPDLVATTVHQIQSPMRRIRVQALNSQGPRMAAMIKYLDVDDDVAILQVPGLRITPGPIHPITAGDPRRGVAFGVGEGGAPQGSLKRVPVFVSTREEEITRRQWDGLDQPISRRNVYTVAGALDSGMSGGAIYSTNVADMSTGWGFQGLIRSRVPFRAFGGGIAVPARIVQQALAAAQAMPQWREMRPTSCPQWHRPRTP